MGDNGRGGVAVAEHRGEAVVREDFGGGEGEFTSKKPGVVTHDHGFGFGGGDRLEVVGYALGSEADVVEGEIAGDEAAPAAGAKFNHSE